MVNAIDQIWTNFHLIDRKFQKYSNFLCRPVSGVIPLAKAGKLPALGERRSVMSNHHHWPSKLDALAAATADEVWQNEVSRLKEDIARNTRKRLYQAYAEWEEQQQGQPSRPTSTWSTSTWLRGIFKSLFPQKPLQAVTRMAIVGSAALMAFAAWYVTAEADKRARLALQMRDCSIAAFQLEVRDDAQGRTFTLFQQVPSECPTRKLRVSGRTAIKTTPDNSWPARAFAALEGDFLKAHKHFLLGLDWRGPLRALRTAGTYGGSNPLLSALEQATQQPSSVMDKVVNYVAASRLSKMLGDDRARLRFVLEATTCITGTGQDLGGLDIAGGACSLVLFGKSTAEVRPAESCLWAASARRPFRASFGYTDRPNYEAVQRGHAILARAYHCLERMHARGWLDRNQLQQEQAHLAAWRPPIQQVTDGQRTRLTMVPAAMVRAATR